MRRFTYTLISVFAIILVIFLAVSFRENTSDTQSIFKDTSRRHRYAIKKNNCSGSNPLNFLCASICCN